MGASPEHYAGREQAYVKHFLLRNYFSDLIHKIASVYDEIVYIDGYSGPWQSVDVSLADTSFVIALEEDAQRQRSMEEGPGRDVRMHAMLVEKRASAFAELEKIPAKFPDIGIQPFRGEFVWLVPSKVGSGIERHVLADPDHSAENAAEIVCLRLHRS